MRLFLVTFVLLVVPTCLFADNADARAALALAVGSAKKTTEKPTESEGDAKAALALAYWLLHKAEEVKPQPPAVTTLKEFPGVSAAFSTNKPFVLFVGRTKPTSDIDACVFYRADTHDNFAGPGVVIYVPSGGGWVQTVIKGEISLDDIKAVIQRVESKPTSQLPVQQFSWPAHSFSQPYCPPGRA